MEKNKTKSGKTAYFTKTQWVEKKFDLHMKSKEIKRGSKQWIEYQEIFFLGASSALDCMPSEWKDKLARQEPI